jgi:tetratricopeptide (TPR) repeat protein
VTFDQLDGTARGRLRTLSKDNAEDVGRHLVMAGKLMDIDPERAYLHAQVAVSRGGRVDIVREAAALTAYATGRYAEALKEFRTVRRLSGSGEHLALMADCERGLGRPERAIALSQEPDASSLDPAAQAELRIVVAGARMDMGDAEAALLVLARVSTKDPAVQARVDEAKVDVLRSMGRNEEAERIASALVPEDTTPEETWADEVLLYDTEELPPPAPEPVRTESEEADEISVSEDESPADGDVPEPPEHKPSPSEGASE